jgi:hypothetical protein
MNADFSTTTRRTDDELTTSQRFVTTTREEFEEFLAADVPGAFTRTPGAEEYIYASEVPAAHLRLRVFSSIDRKNDVSRAKGTDAIRTVLWDRRVSHPVGGRERTHRIGTWRTNLREKIEHLRAISPRYAIDGECPDCGSTLFVREGEYGEFLGCASYPECDHTEALPEVSAE